MCGIVGIAGKEGKTCVSSMNALLKHRGPDDVGEYYDSVTNIFLAMRRLEILDLAGGHQPMSNEDGSVWIVFNGEIYNAPDIRANLIEEGHAFKTLNSDTEVLVHLYESKQEAMLKELNGMFGFVIYDKIRNVLFGAPDRIGIKPLYYASRSGFFAFASELKSLLLLPGINREINFKSLFNYMSLLYIPGEDSILQGIKRLLPGHFFLYDLKAGVLKVQKYWDIDFSLVEYRNENEWCELIRSELREAVKRWLLSDVPIACSLSGGIDSSSIVGLLGEIGYSPIKTYSLGFVRPGEEKWNELPLARLVAERWGTEHYELILKPEELLNDLIKMVWYLDEPYGGGLPSWYVFKFMSKDVKVALTGTGGDELFGNYGKFLPLENSPLGRLAFACYCLFNLRGRHLDNFWKPLAHLISKIPDKFLPGNRKQQLIDLPAICRDPLRRYYFDILYYLSDEMKHELVFQIQMDDTYNTWSLLRELYEQRGKQDVRNGIAYVDFKTQLPEEFLLMTDRFSMAHSLEARVPYLDHKLVELVFRIPSSVRTRPDNIKYLLKKAVADLLPPEILAEKKRGFVIPVSLWLRNELRPLIERLLSPERLLRQGIFRPAFYEHFVKPHLDGRADFTWQVWAALMFQLWYLVFIEEKVYSTPSFSLGDIQ